MIRRIVMALTAAAFATITAVQARQQETVSWSCSASAPDACYFHLCRFTGGVATFVIPAGRSTHISGASETIPGKDTYCVEVNQLPTACRCKTVTADTND
jgi:hypothetical protein